MFTFKKIVRGTKRGLMNEIERLENNGWTIERSESTPRGTRTNKLTYIAYLKREI